MKFLVMQTYGDDQSRTSKLFLFFCSRPRLGKSKLIEVSSPVVHFQCILIAEVV